MCIKLSFSPILIKRTAKKNISFPKLKNELIGSEVGNKIFMYCPRTEVMNCFEGEDTIASYTSV